MKVVLDTNIILAAFSSNSPYRQIIDDLFYQRYDLYVVNDILLEYEEKLKEKFDPVAAELFISALTMLSNVHKIETYFQFQLIKQDEDDNKFVDCAVAANVQFIVTNDKHFRILQEVSFPKVETVSIQAFMEILQQLDSETE